MVAALGLGRHALFFRLPQGGPSFVRRHPQAPPRLGVKRRRAFRSPSLTLASIFEPSPIRPCEVSLSPTDAVGFPLHGAPVERPPVADDEPLVPPFPLHVCMFLQGADGVAIPSQENPPPIDQALARNLGVVAEIEAGHGREGDADSGSESSR